MMTFNEYVDFEVGEISSDVFEIRIPVRDEYINDLGTMHGAIIMAIADIATGFLAIDMKYLAPTQSSYTNFLRPIKETDYIYARAEVIKRGKRAATIDCKVWSDDTDLAAVNRSEFTVIDESVKDNPSKMVKRLMDGDYKTYKKTSRIS